MTGLTLGLGLGLNYTRTAGGGAVPVISIQSGSGYQGSVLESTEAGQWKVNGVDVGGASETTLTVQPEHDGLEITVTSGSGTSDPFQMWIPTMLSTAPRAWFDALDTSTISYGTGSLVAQWDSRVGSYAATQGTASDQPTHDTNKITSAASDFLDLPNAILSGLTAAQIVMCIEPSLIGSWGRITSSNTSNHTPYSDNACYENFASSSRPVFPGYGPISGTRIHSAKQTGTELSVFRNGVQIGSAQAATFATGEASSDEFTRFFGGTACSLFEAIVLSDDDNDDRQQVEGYLAHRRGVAASLDAGHPYKTASSMRVQ